MAADRYRVVARALNVRDAPGLAGRPIAVLAEGTVVERLGTSGDEYWYRVQLSSGGAGWVSHKYLRRVGQDGSEGQPLWLAIARAEIGVKEFAGGADNPRIVEYLSSTTLSGPSRHEDETPWCSAFANWCLERAGYEGTDSAWARSWLHWGREVAQPVEGCIAVLERGSGGHVGFFIGQSEGTLQLLGGNQRDQVRISDYPRNRLLGYRLPGDPA